MAAVAEGFFLTAAATADCRNFAIDLDLLFLGVPDDEIPGNQGRTVFQNMNPGEFGFHLYGGAGLGGDEFIAFQVGERPGGTRVHNLHDLFAVGGMNIDPGFLLGIEDFGQSDQTIGRMDT